MTNSKNTKRALCASILSVVLCVAMLIGSTFAWFTDSVTSGQNKIVAGNLDVKFSYKNAKTAATSGADFKEVTATTTDLFVNSEGGEILWEPGAAAVSYLKLENEGSLALKYQLAVDAEDVVTGADGAALSKVLKTAVVEIKEAEVGIYTREAAIAAAKADGAESVLTYVKEGKMTADAEPSYLAMIVYFPEEIGNEVDGAVYNRGDVKLETDLSLNLVATQDTVEEDSFGKDYDEDAGYPVQYAATEAQLKDAIANVENGGTVILNNDIQLSEDTPITVEDGKSVTVDMNGKTLTNTANIYDESVYNWSVFSVRGGELTITGNGTVQAKENDAYVADLQYGGKLTIESGTFIGNLSAVYVHTGELVINGGNFSIQQLAGDYGDPYRYTLNCRDDKYINGTAKITVNGGRFYGFNPADNAAEGAGTNFVAAGLSVVENDGWYTVGKAVDGAQGLGEAVKQGGFVILTEDVSLSSPLTLSDEKVQIHLNDKELKSAAEINLIQATGSADVTVSGGTLSVNNAKAAVVFAQDSANVVVEDCDLVSENGYYVAVTNGALSDNVNMTLKNSTLTAEKSYACYFPAGTITMENCNVTGAVIISGGDVTIDGGTYTADGFSNQAQIWHKDDTISYMEKFKTKDGCGHMGDSILIMDRRGSGYGAANVTIQNATFNTELNLADSSKATAYAIKYVDYNNIPGAERGRLTITGNTYNHKLTGGQDPLMFIGIDGTDIGVR